MNVTFLGQWVFDRLELSCCAVVDSERKLNLLALIGKCTSNLLLWIFQSKRVKPQNQKTINKEDSGGRVTLPRFTHTQGPVQSKLTLHLPTPT